MRILISKLKEISALIMIFAIGLFLIAIGSGCASLPAENKYANFLEYIGLPEVTVTHYQDNKQSGFCDWDFGVIAIYGKELGDKASDEVFIHEAAHLYCKKAFNVRGHGIEFLTCLELVKCKWRKFK